jgi:hypothetical protein
MFSQIIPLYVSMMGMELTQTDAASSRVEREPAERCCGRGIDPSVNEYSCYTSSSISIPLRLLSTGSQLILTHTLHCLTMESVAY